jgi:DNA-binding transcriptional LysR family regulator
MNLRSLSYFVVVSEELNLHRAAERLHIVQPALSRQIKALEKELDARLFVRGARGLSLTSPGKLFLKDARLMLELGRQARRRVSAADRGELGTVRLGFHEVAHRYGVFRGLISQFITRNPGVHFQFRVSSSQQQIELLGSGEIDVGFIYVWEPVPGHLLSTRLRRETFVLAMPEAHPLATLERISAADVADKPFVWVERSRNRAQSDALIKMCTRAGFVPNTVHEGVTSEAATLSLVAAGAGFAFVPSSARQHASGVVLREVADLCVELEFHMAWRAAARAAAVERFISAAENSLSEPPAKSS